MVKTRLVVVMSPKISMRPGLCTVVPLSTTAPIPVAPYHCQVELDPAPPDPWGPGVRWVKGDMICAVGFHRLDLIRTGKDRSGARTYRFEVLPPGDMAKIRKCILSSLGMASLTKHL